MKFRKLYWVTEQLGKGEASQVAGVYTSIPDLVERGIQWRDGIDKRDGFRLTLVALDSMKKPLGSWVLPEIGGLEEDLACYVRDNEFGSAEVELLVNALKNFCVKV